MIGCMALRESGGAVIALQSGFYLFDFERGDATLIFDPEPGEERTRFNDGKVDRQGRFLAGSMNLNGIKDGLGLGTLYRLNTDFSLDTLRDDVVLSNGPCFSPVGGTFYFADTAHRTIWAYDYESDTGALSNMRTFVDFEPLMARLWMQTVACGAHSLRRVRSVVSHQMGSLCGVSTYRQIILPA